MKNTQKNYREKCDCHHFSEGAGSRVKGIPLEEGVWKTLCSIAEELKVRVPEMGNGGC
jgi:hypothetical protein